MTRTARRLLVALNIGNWLAVAFFAVMAGLLLLGLPPASTRVAHAALPGMAAPLGRLMVAMFAIGIAMGVAVDRLFRRLLAMVDSVEAGRPFTRANASRLRQAAAALLAVQLLDLAFADVVARLAPLARHPIFGWSPSVTGWIAVLLLWVLATVFARGADMADELEATV